MIRSRTEENLLVDPTLPLTSSSSTQYSRHLKPFGPVNVTIVVVVVVVVVVDDDDDDRRILMIVALRVQNVLASGKYTPKTSEMTELLPADWGPHATNCGNKDNSSSYKHLSFFDPPSVVRTLSMVSSVFGMRSDRPSSIRRLVNGRPSTPHSCAGSVTHLCVFIVVDSGECNQED